MATGNEILSYKGNADLGGFSSDGTPLLGTEKDHYGDLATILRDVQNRDAIWQAGQYQQAIKDRDESAKLFAEQDVALPLEKEDQARVEQKYNTVKDVMLKYHGNPLAHKKGRVEIQTAIADFKKDRAIAQTRNQEAVKQKLAIANETDPEDRAARIKSLQEQMAVPGKIPDPYYKPFVTDVGKSIPQFELKTVGKPEYIKGPNGYYTRTTKESSIPTIKNYYGPLNVMEGPDKSLLNHITGTYNGLLNGGKVGNDQYKFMNAQLDAINKKMGYQPGTEEYETPIAIIEPGSGKMVPIDNALDYVRKYALAYQGNVQKTEDVLDEKANKFFKDQEDIKKDESQIRETNARTGLIGAQIKTENARRQYEIEKLKADTRKAEIDGDVALAKSLQTQEKFVGTGAKVFNAFEKLATNKSFVPVRNLPAAAQEIVKSQFGNIDDLEIVQLPLSNPVFAQMGSKPNTDIEGKLAPGAIKASTMFAVRPKGSAGNLDSYQVVSINKDKKGEVTADIFDVSEGAARLVKYDAGFRSDASMDDDISAVRAVTKRMLANPSNQQTSTTQDATSNIVPQSSIGSADQRRGANGIEVRVNGEWRTAIGRDVNGNIILK